MPSSLGDMVGRMRVPRSLRRREGCIMMRAAARRNLRKNGGELLTTLNGLLMPESCQTIWVGLARTDRV